MAVFNEPTQWSHTLGNNADVSTLPDDTSATSGVASLQKLFQLINQTPLEAGGVAPSREDFNALFKFLGDSIFYMQNGGLWSYNSAFDYAVGRVVLYNGNLYKCIQANGASSTVVTPDSISPLGSDYWAQVATLADFANFANTDLSNLSASGQALFTAKADTDLSNVPSSKGILVESYVNGTSWYRKYSDGWCEQGGYNGQLIQLCPTITLLVPYRDTNYSVQITTESGNTGTVHIGYNTVDQKTTTSFTTGFGEYQSSSVFFFGYWYACGYVN